MRHLIILLIFITTNSFSQIGDTIYFDKDWKPSSPDKFNYYRLYEINDSVVKIMDYYKNNSIQNISYCALDSTQIFTSDTDNLLGSSIWYDKKGRKEQIKIHQPLNNPSMIYNITGDTTDFEEFIKSNLIYIAGYYNNGNIKYQGFLYDDCDQHLIWRYYFKDGHIWQTRKYNYGQLLETKSYHDNDTVRAIKQYVNNKIVVKKKYNKNGELKKTKVYEDGQKKKIR